MAQFRVLAVESHWTCYAHFTLEIMRLTRAVEADFPEVVELANRAYRGTGAGASWNVEEGIIEGQRLTESLLREDVAARPEAHLLLYRDEAQGTLLGTVWLEPKENGVWYLGLLTVRPDLQDRQLGRTLLAAAEDFAKERDGQRIRMSVVYVREALIAWYTRRGYALTGETEPFPFGDERFGRPLRDDLYFAVLEKSIQPD
jgi:ribosomal protein S18 acetylase RimI-like enzyme